MYTFNVGSFSVDIGESFVHLHGYAVRDTDIAIPSVCPSRSDIMFNDNYKP